MKARRDAGFILPLAMVMTVVLGAVVVGVATYSAASLRYGRTVERRVERLAASDAGMHIALEKLRTKSATCTATPTTLYVATINSKSVKVTCTRTAILSSEANQFAVVVTGVGVPSGSASWIAQGTNNSSQSRQIGGNVYIASPPAALDKPVNITNGDLWYPAAGNGACVDPSWSNLTFSPADERGFNCTTSTWQTMFPVPLLPAPPVIARGASGVTDSNGCTVFQPGVYTSPPIIGSGTQNFFAPGTYYFHFDGRISIKNALVIGGVTGQSGLGSSPVARTPTTFTSPWCASAIAAATNGAAPNTGVSWIFGGSSGIAIDPNGQLELFAPPRLVALPAINPSIVALQSTSGGYAPNTLGSVGTPLIDLQEGSNDGIVVHGGVWAPANAVNLGNIAQAANGEFMGGLVVGLLNMQTAASIGNFNMSVLTGPSQRKVNLTSVADQLTTTQVVALIRSSTGTISINSWRITS